jgi:hypothetical protein
MSRVVFEPTIPVFERAKTFHTLQFAATVIVRIESLRTQSQNPPWDTILNQFDLPNLMLHSHLFPGLPSDCFSGGFQHTLRYLSLYEEVRFFIVLV